MGNISGHGGAREGAGRKPGARSDAAIAFDDARARNEAAKAGINELELKIKTGEYLPRDAYRQANATALAMLTQAIRSIPDNLERQLGLAPEVLDAIGEMHDAALEAVAQAFKQMGGE